MRHIRNGTVVCLLAVGLLAMPGASANVPEPGSDSVHLLPARTIERTDAPTPGTARPADAHEMSASAEEQELFTLANRERTSRELQPLRWDAALASVARVHALQMSGTGSLYHNPTLAADVTAAVPLWQGTGENVGYGHSIGAIHTALMSSPSHRANILGDFTSVGIGVAAGVDGGLWVTQVFVREDDAPAPLPPKPAPPAPDPVPPPAPARETEPMVVQAAVSEQPSTADDPHAPPISTRAAEPSRSVVEQRSPQTASPSAARQPLLPALGIFLLAVGVVVGSGRRRRAGGASGTG